MLGGARGRMLPQSIFEVHASPDTFQSVSIQQFHRCHTETCSMSKFSEMLGYDINFLRLLSIIRHTLGHRTLCFSSYIEVIGLLLNVF